ncbi:hypothetical protein [Formosa haliotis]|uniref:hypothetical protein n=1 Tax=Formosa haliotis TaxID=1555194 RepID=UPI0008245AF4|nr:hypothetical protein [Formosa haliotis]
MQKSISYIFHPVLMPLVGVLFYFSKSPRYIPLPIIKDKLIAISILTILLPILGILLLKTLGRISSIELKQTKDRVLPLFIYCGIILIVLKRVLTAYEFIELYYFFVGMLASTLSCLMLVLLKYKASIHMIAISGVFMFFIGLSIHFSINILGSIALVIFLMGLIATSRLSLKAHSTAELIIGCAVGIIPQLILIPHWL